MGLHVVPDEETVPTRGLRVRGDLRAFSHDRHRTDRKNRAIRCEECQRILVRTAESGL